MYKLVLAWYWNPSFSPLAKYTQIPAKDPKSHIIQHLLCSLTLSTKESIAHLLQLDILGLSSSQVSCATNMDKGLQ